jgi:dTDP-4-dehydrorhamnose reductase
MTMRVLLIGANGQLGSDLVPALSTHVNLCPLTHRDIELTEQASVDLVLSAYAPDLVINTAAFNRVDDAEDQPAAAFRINAVGAQILARSCSRIGARLLHVSTDYVFSGDRTRPWSEHDCPQPVSVYGISKLAGELAVRAASPDSYIVRVSGLFGLAGSRGKGGNFVETMLQLQAEGRVIRVVDDQILAPTYTRDLAQKLSEFVLTRPPAGTYHMTAAGSCSWYEFARAIFDLAQLDVELYPQSTAEAGSRAKRPAFSVLSNDSLRAIGLAQIRPWVGGLGEYLEHRAIQRRTAHQLVGV